jgi:hypothetical protein
MESLLVVLLLAASAALLCLRPRFNGWARRERAAGRETLWTKNIGTSASTVRASRAAILGDRFGVPLVIALLVVSLMTGGSARISLLVSAVVIVVVIYALRIRS